MLRNEEWQVEEGLVLKEGRVYVPKDEKLRMEIIRLHHDIPIAGHGGQWKMVELVTRNYWWPGVTKKVKQYVEGCDQCQRMKNRAEMPAGKLRPNQIPERPWQHILVDFIMKLPVSKSYDSILVVCNRFSKMSHFVVTVVATTRHSRINDLTTSKALSRLSSNEWGITRELNKEPSLHCSSIYINIMWSVLQQYVYLMSYYLSTMPCPCVLTSYSFNLHHYVYTMRNHSPLISSLTLTLI